ncbi:MAG: glycosyltransferase [Hoeflea sp.]|uniref:glycosyltransferase family 2 protein n=1 Tax=Hoeflea sp. TaxID=1940281 RepID=UPI001D9DCFD8|nr:glycosyltransferase family 2 protein [Hoeflea sp.]MBU4531361.1 glycosyltransferase [Alphaproteobacteria bacterium]MBU4544218.1 glycosyltransferase [Alphaproteobacteria bacterium]MBU4550545.1 glycosyltransferase [Alphaproteobacteria bacterium]MBV1724637.1 glycosyltransferase [Hoeflea sp.]MBV1760657.1 glycosyltransferase [Hoeflea sp.]
MVQGDHLVSVGVPVYDRPELLKRRLANIVGQTYRNLEIIVSDNASPKPEMEAIARAYAASDPRIRYVRQATNIGAGANFEFVLSCSTGKYFAWAADDDEWDENFVEVCVAGIGSAQIFMPNMAVKYLKSGAIQKTPVPQLSPSVSPATNILRFMKNMQPGLFYGLHDRQALLEIIGTFYHDMSDVALIVRAILGKGVQTGDGAEYRAGIFDEAYKPKPANSVRFSYGPFLRGVLIAIARSPRLSAREKMVVGYRVTQATVKLMVHLTRAYPEVAGWHHKAYTALRTPSGARSILFSRKS